MPFEKLGTSFGSLAGPRWCLLHTPLLGFGLLILTALETVFQLSRSSQPSALEDLLFTLWPQVWPAFSGRKGD